MNKQPFTGFTEADQALLDRLQSFLPDKIFDAHAHLHKAEHMPEDNLLRLYGTADAKRFKKDQEEFFGNRTFRALFLPFPTKLMLSSELRLEVNKWMIRQLEEAKDCVAAIYVAPNDTVEQIESLLTHPGVKGFKCYHLTAKTDGPTFQADICQYLPESAWKVADAREMTITLHMVKSKALADEVNLEYIKTMTAKYPHAKLILAHCARGFASWTAIETVRKLKGIPNIYYDMAAVSDPATIAEVIRQGGADHVLWGSDYAIDRLHAKCISTGEDFHWLYDHDLPKEAGIPLQYTILESMFAFYQASLLLDLSRKEIEDIFYYNAIRLFGLEELV